MASRLIPKTPEPVKFIQNQGSKGILDDFAVRKNVATKEGTIEQVPTQDNHIVNKKYVDDADALLVPYTGATEDVDLGDFDLTATEVTANTAKIYGIDDGQEVITNGAIFANIGSGRMIFDNYNSPERDYFNNFFGFEADYPRVSIFGHSDPGAFGFFQWDEDLQDWKYWWEFGSGAAHHLNFYNVDYGAMAFQIAYDTNNMLIGEDFNNVGDQGQKLQVYGDGIFINSGDGTSPQINVPYMTERTAFNFETTFSECYGRFKDSYSEGYMGSRNGQFFLQSDNSLGFVRIENYGGGLGGLDVNEIDSSENGQLLIVAPYGWASDNYSVYTDGTGGLVSAFYDCGSYQINSTSIQLNTNQDFLFNTAGGGSYWKWVQSGSLLKASLDTSGNYYLLGNINQNNILNQKSETKTLTNNTATGFVDIALTSGQMVSGHVDYAIYVTGGSSDLQTHSGSVFFSAVNKGGTITTDIKETYLNPSDCLAVSAGTLTDSWTNVAGTNKITLKCNANTSLSSPTITLKYTIKSLSTNTITKL